MKVCVFGCYAHMPDACIVGYLLAYGVRMCLRISMHVCIHWLIGIVVFVRTHTSGLERWAQKIVRRQEEKSRISGW